ncbi:hypothetical protein HD553DRAFT_326188 [Filobasidium floriforme]|uniref:uncharacterized protein n=1 Tax=Filobasidium floriforme TaxID=5210 RepID=UPI001E8E8238|nr:uncharacterized protein HD553DRAFT_326188 [Filobasidium floriforme]KAH8079847.1 hypothetical protein HD553DRAFT_326188 [Filobasidium floriforme]
MPDPSLNSHKQPSTDRNSGSDSSQAAGSLSQAHLQATPLHRDLLLRRQHPVDQELTGTPEDHWEILADRLRNQPFARIPGASPLVKSQSSVHQSLSTIVESRCVDQPPSEHHIAPDMLTGEEAIFSVESWTPDQSSKSSSSILTAQHGSFDPEETTHRYLQNLRDAIDSLDSEGLAWRHEGAAEKTTLSELVDLLSDTKDAFTVAGSNQSRNPKQEKILFLGEMGQGVVKKLKFLRGS